MRKIKFRAFEIDSKEMLLPSTDNNNGYFFSGFNEGYLKVATSLYSDDVDYVLMQYTGLKDKNKVEIYEGDIISFAKGVLSSREENRGSVIWDEKEYVIRNEHGYLNYPSKQAELWGWLKHIEVIGNIYENPELLSNTDTSKTQ